MHEGSSRFPNIRPFLPSLLMHWLAHLMRYTPIRKHVRCSTMKVSSSSS